jgi:quercetin dioxygenase-like cupin family protein
MPESKSPYPPVRRVITGHDADKVAKVIIDDHASNAKYPAPGMVSTMIWCTDSAPADISIGNVEDLGARVIGTPPPPHGTRLAVLDFPPDVKPIMHRTETIDYVIVLSGELEMDMDDSNVKLKAGDIVVQRGTNHAWANRSGKPARIAVVLVDAKPLGIGKAVSGNVSASNH